MAREFDKALALMVYETWLLHGATSEALPKVSVQKWCNRQVKRKLFPCTKPDANKQGEA